jgi:hypothetical protein
MTTTDSSPSEHVDTRHRLAHVDRLRTELAVDGLHVLDHPDLRDWPSYTPTEIVPGLFQGGTEDHDVLSEPLPTGAGWSRAGYPFDLVVTLYADARPVPWGVQELRFGFPDAAPGTAELAVVGRLADLAFERWVDGDQVLIRCQAGVNRSGLVTALVLLRAGLAPEQAIRQIRRTRGAASLCNDHFVHWLLGHDSTRTPGSVIAVAPTA